jgi:DNA repair protein RecO (recombination protein O)
VNARYHLGHGIVIRRQTLPSGDLVVTLLAEQGKWRGVARKGKLPGGNLGRLSLFHDVTVQYYRKRDEDLALLTQIRLNGALPRLADPSVYPYAHILAELVDALTVDVNIGEPLYQYLASGLRGLDRHHDPERVALLYGWRLLQQAGLAPQTSTCAGCGSEGPLEVLDVPAGSLKCASCAGEGLRLGPETTEELRSMLTGGMREALELALCDRPSHWLALSRYLAYHVRELRSLSQTSAGGRPNSV